MKNPSRIIYALSAIFASAAIAASCEKVPEETVTTDDGQTEEPAVLDAPVPVVEDQTATSFTVAWEAVENADSYVYTINSGEEQTTSGTSVSFTGLSEGEYTVKVKATSGDGRYTDSVWASCEVTLAAEETGTFTLDVYLSDKYASYGQYRYNSVWFTAKGSDITAASYTCYTYREGFSDEDMTAEFEAGGDYIYPVAGQELALLLTAGFENGFIGLPSETTFEIAFYVTFTDGKKQLYRKTVTTEAAPGTF